MTESRQVPAPESDSKRIPTIGDWEWHDNTEHTDDHLHVSLVCLNVVDRSNIPFTVLIGTNDSGRYVWWASGYIDGCQVVYTGPHMWNRWSKTGGSDDWDTAARNAEANLKRLGFKQEKPPKSKPYPRMCTTCGEVSVTKCRIPYDAEVRHNGKLHAFSIASLGIDQCENCGEQFFTTSTDEEINLALHRALASGSCLIRPIY